MMIDQNHISKHFDKADYRDIPLTRGDYEECTFDQCNFSDSDLSNFNFYDCNFNGCNLSLARLSNNTMNNVLFKDCKLMGLHFETCNPILFTVGFDRCTLNLASFYRVKMKKTKFIGCSLRECDFTESDLSLSVFDHCDLMGARFENTNLEKADLRLAYHYTIDPEMNRIQKAKFSKEGIMGLLYKWDIEIE